MKRCKKNIKNIMGFTLVETMVSSLILIICVFGFSKAYLNAQDNQKMAAKRNQAVRAGQIVMETLISYNGDKVALSTKLSNPINITEGDKTYTVTVQGIKSWNGTIISESGLSTADTSLSPAVIQLKVPIDNSANNNLFVYPTYVVTF